MKRIATIILISLCIYSCKKDKTEPVKYNKQYYENNEYIDINSIDYLMEWQNYFDNEERNLFHIDYGYNAKNFRFVASDAMPKELKNLKTIKYLKENNISHDILIEHYNNHKSKYSGCDVSDIALCYFTSDNMVGTTHYVYSFIRSIVYEDVYIYELYKIYEKQH